MEIRVREKPEITMIGLVATGNSVMDIDIAELWQDFEKRYNEIIHAVPETSYEVHTEDPSGLKQHTCFVGVEVTKLDDVPDEMVVNVIPAGQYAVFTHSFRDGGFDAAYQEVYRCIEQSKYSLVHPFDIQCYDSRFKGPNNPDSMLDIWVPIK